MSPLFRDLIGGVLLMIAIGMTVYLLHALPDPAEIEQWAEEQEMTI